VRILLLGSGGREHALAAALVNDPSVTALVCAPGNPGIAGVRGATGVQVQLAPADLTDIGAVVSLASAGVAADLVIVGPEAPLVAGLADAVRAKGIACFGPSGAAAVLEGSKAFAKEIPFEEVNKL